MKRIFCILLCVVLIILSSVGCGVEQPVETTEPTIPAPVELEVAYEPEQKRQKYEGVQLRVLSMYWDTDPEAQVMLQAAQAFYSQTGAQVQILWATDAASGVEGCDVFQTGIASLDGVLLSRTLDLTQMAENAGYDQKSFSSLRRQVIDRCGFLAGIPQIPSITGVYYVKDVFDAAGVETAPGTWEEFLAVSQTLRESDYEALALNKEDEVLAAYLHLEQRLGSDRLVKTEADKSKFASDEALLESAGQIIDFVSGGNLLTSAYPGGQNKLGLSNAAMTVGSNVLCAEVENAACVNLNWGVFPWPGEGTGAGCLISSDVLCVHKDSENMQAAFDFVMLLCTGEFDQLRADLTEGIPADPANESPITGAVELLQNAQKATAQLPGELPAEVFSKLWQGKYKTAEQFAKSWDKSR